MINILKKVNLSELTYYGIGGMADTVLMCKSAEDVLEAVRYARKEATGSMRVLGLGANMIIEDKPYEGVYVCLRGEGVEHEVNGGNITSFAGESVDSLINYSFKQKLTGIEWAGGLPSTIGGAVRGNAGAFGNEMKDMVVSVDYVDLADEELAVKTLDNNACEFSYRNSFFKQNPSLLILSVTTKNHPASQDELEKAEEVYRKNIDYRISHHPMEYPSCGSVFKNIVVKEDVEKILSVWPDIADLSKDKWHNKISMGYVVNRLGFSGKKNGGAMVSPKHTNYIVNVDKATSKDVVGLIEDISNEFKKTFGFTPEPEVVIM